MIGQTISHYRILEKLGEGGMGVVYKAHDTKLDRDVAVKFLPHHITVNEAEQARFLQEARAAAVLNHPNICTVHAIEKGDDQQFIVMEYVDGVTLREKIAAGRMQMADCIGYALQIGDALQEAHSKGIVHRDVKTDNIMVNSKNQIKVMDFGLAKLKGSLKLTRTSSTVGTLAYMAPEQIQGGEVDARSDIFSFGAVLYEMLTGHLPFRGEHEAAMMYSILNEAPELLQQFLPDAPPELVHVLSRALEKDPEDRYQAVHDMVIDLRRLKKETSRVLRPSDGLSSDSINSRKDDLRTKWRRPSAFGAGAVVLLVILYVLVWPSIRDTVFGTKSISLMVIPFDNQTGDPKFDNLSVVIPNLLITSLEQSTALTVTTSERMRDLLKQMGKADVKAVDTDLGFDLCRRDSVRALVTGSFVKLGNTFATDVKVIDVETKKLLKSAKSTGEGAESILKHQIDDLGKQIATGIGLPDSKVAAEQKTATSITTASFDAYNFYVRGVTEYEKMYYDVARPFFEKAISLDSTFAMAHLALARSCTWLGDHQSARASYERAFTFSENAARKEKLLTQAAHADAIEGNQEKQHRILRQLEAEFPKEKEIQYRLYLLGGDGAISHLQHAIQLDPTWGLAVNQLAYEHFWRGEYENAIAQLRHYIALSPGDANPYDSMGECFFFMGKLDESIANYIQASEIKPGLRSYLKIGYVYALNENYSEAVDWIEKRPIGNWSLAEENSTNCMRGFLAWWLGKNSELSARIAEARELYKKSRSRAHAALMQSLKATLSAERREYERSRSELTEAARLMADAESEARGVLQLFARLLELQRTKVFLLEGQTKPVDKVLADLTPPPGLPNFANTYIRFAAHQLHGEMLLVQGRLDEAINQLRNPPTLPTPFLSFPEFVGYYNIYFTRDALARAYVRKGALDSAIAEYERITRFDPTSKDRRLIHPLHHYELAKLYEKKGMEEKAIARYEKFLSIWKNADAEHPEPKDARIRLAKLKH